MVKMIESGLQLSEYQVSWNDCFGQKTQSLLANDPSLPANDTTLLAKDTTLLANDTSLLANETIPSGKWHNTFWQKIQSLLVYNTIPSGKRYSYFLQMIQSFLANDRSLIAEDKPFQMIQSFSLDTTLLANDTTLLANEPIPSDKWYNNFWQMIQ